MKLKGTKYYNLSKIWKIYVLKTIQSYHLDQKEGVPRTRLSVEVWDVLTPATAKITAVGKNASLRVPRTIVCLILMVFGLGMHATSTGTPNQWVICNVIVANT